AQGSGPGGGVAICVPRTSPVRGGCGGPADPVDRLCGLRVRRRREVVAQQTHAPIMTRSGRHCGPTAKQESAYRTAATRAFRPAFVVTHGETARRRGRCRHRFVWVAGLVAAAGPVTHKDSWPWRASPA